MSTTTRRAAQLATIVLTGAGALAVGAGAASALPTTTVVSASASSTAATSVVASPRLTSAQIADLTDVAENRLDRPPIWCCGNLGPLAGLLDEPATPAVDVADIAAGVTTRG